MSYTELHTGKFSIVAKGVDEIDAYINANNLTDKVDRDEYNGKVSYYIDDKEGYDIVVANDIPVMIQYDYHNEEEASDYVSHINKAADGSYNFVMMFYNGGTCLSEMIGDELKHLI
jgi:hypothetical protein